jgi:tRNA A37 N6-isopentenylltransferase MiaA
MLERGVEEEVREALVGPVSPTARHVHGLREIAELPREEAIEALIARTSRYAIHQLRWMRRIPDIVTIGAERSAGEIADDVLRTAELK